MNFTSAVVKVTSHCNLNCSYCYLYNMGDDTPVSQPKIFSNKLMDALIEKVKIHCRENGIREFHFAFQGGEPLLARREFYERFVDVANDAFRRMTRPTFSIETNGVLLTEEWSNLFAELNIEIGLSLDGQKETNDQYRPDLKGRGSYNKAVKGLRAAIKNNFHKETLKILCVVNPETDPLSSYAHFKQLQAGHLDYFLPAGNYDRQSGRVKVLDEKTTAYADWLIAVFNEWNNDADPSKPEIGIFRRIIQSLSGPNERGIFGTNRSSAPLFIQTDGRLTAQDSLISCGSGFTKTNLNILTHGLSSLEETMFGKLYFNSHSQLNKRCLACSFKHVCQGGELHTRYSSENGFNNPSIYCRDILKLITHVQNALYSSQNLVSTDMQLLSYDHALSMIERNLNKIKEPEYTASLEHFSATQSNMAPSA